MFPTIRTARAICKKGDLQGVIVIGIDERGVVGGASYGATVRQCKALAPWLDEIVGGAGFSCDLNVFVPKASLSSETQGGET